MAESAELLSKLRKLISMRDGAEKVGSFAEAEVAATKLTELLAKYNLTMQEVLVSDLPAIQSEWIFPDLEGNRTAWTTALGVALQEAFNVTFLCNADGSNSACFIGRSPHRETAVYLYMYLIRALHEAQDKSYRSQYNKLRNSGVKPELKGYRTAFISGAIARLRKRLLDTQQEVISAAPVTIQANALVLVQRERAAIAEFLENSFAGKLEQAAPKELKGPTNNTGGNMGKAAGTQWASNLPIHKGIGGNTKAAALTSGR